MDLLLTHGYFLYEDERELQIMKPYVPLGILYICSHLRSRGFAVEVFDSTFSSSNELFTLLRSTPPAILGIYANLMTRRKALEIARTAREAGWQVVVGGPEPGAYVDEYLQAGADVVVIGEGENTLEELLPALRSGSHRDLERVKGIAFRSAEGQVCRTAPRPQIANLDAQPWPAREAVDIDRYVSTWRDHHGTGSVSFITARGCPYSCRWCSHQVFGKTHRRRSPLAVVDEVEWLLDRYHPEMTWIADDVFTIHHGWLFQYAAEMKRRSLKVPFECISRADRLSTKVIETLAELGCFRIWIGSESGSQRILDAMDRGVTVEQVQTAIAGCKARGIQTGMFLMWGYEGEEIVDIEATVQHVKSSEPDVFLTTVSYPIKGTPYFDEVSPRLLPLPSWELGSDRDLRIRDRHSRRFYLYADQLLRHEVELARVVKKGPTAKQESISKLEHLIAEARKGLHACQGEVEVLS